MAGLTGFDYGEELASYAGSIIHWPTEGDMTALIDGDLLPYKIGFGIDPLNYLRAKNRVESGNFPTMLDTPEGIDACEKMCNDLNNWVKESGCDSALIFLTDSEKNFRLRAAYSRAYKGTRKKDKPPFFYELREFLLTQMGAIISSGEEADDLISIEAWRRFHHLHVPVETAGDPSHKDFYNWVVCSSDKDLRIVPGWNFNPDNRTRRWSTLLGELEPEWKDGKVKKLRGSGLKFFYAQLIMGDSIDNYTGIPRKGDAAAYRALNHLTTEKELYQAVLDMYKIHYGVNHWAINYRGTEKFKLDYKDIHGVEPPEYASFKGRGRLMTAYQMMLEQGRLAHMQRHKGDIWRHKSDMPLGGDIDKWNLPN